jgi:tetratricopeptide (TPR) repeat protein
MSNPVVESRSFKLENAPAPRGLATAPALELTASDGTGLRLVSLSARVVVEDPLAFTELHLVFHNPEPRQLEGRFRIGLPSGASVSRFAMRIGAQWQEGEVVERQAARRAYEDFLHRRQDPALLEHEAGNEFSARVFPIEANGQKEIILSYSHELPGAGGAYRLPLAGLSEIQSLEIRALVGRSGASEAAASSLGGTAASWQVVEVHRTAWTPDVDFEVQPLPSGRTGLRHENLAVVRVAPDLPVAPDEIASLLVLLDTSASRALGHARQVELTRLLGRGLALGAGSGTPFAIACFDQTVEVVFEGTAGDYSAADSQKVLARLALGASDLSGALKWAAARAGVRYERVLLVTDGVATVGDTEAEKIAAAAKSLSEAGVKRLDVLAVGGLRDDASLRRLVTAGLERDGTVCDGDLPLQEIAARLTRATRSGIQVEVPGATWVWPSRLDGMQPGDSALIYADVPAHQAVTVLLDKKPVAGGDLSLGSVERPLLERAWVKARMERLEEMRARPDTDPDVRAGLQKQIADLSVKHRVLSPYTALLVLETEADYERFHIDRHALSDILAVGLSGIELVRRTVASVPVAPSAQATLNALVGKAKKAAAVERSLPSSSSEEDRGEPSHVLANHLLADEDEDETRTAVGAREQRPEPVAAEARDMAFAELDLAPGEQEMAPAPSAAPMPAPASAAAPAPARRPSPPSASMPSPAPARAAAPESPSALRRLANAVTDGVSRLLERPAPPPGPGSPAAQPGAAAPDPEPSPLDSWTGMFRDVMALILAGKAPQALDLALTWRQRSPGDVLALVAIGEAAELAGDLGLAARAYGSLIDLFPSRADLRRFAGERLSRVAAKSALELTIDTYRKAVESRPDHPSGHQLLGMALLRAGRAAEAFDAIAVGQARSYPDKFPGIPRILAEDLGLAAAAWIRAEPAKRAEILGRLSRAGTRLEDEPSVRFVLVWETDANDVDFHIHDAKGGHAFYREKVLPSGGELYADVTQGYGPECFTIRGAPKSRAYPYRLQAHYYRQGPMGFGMGALTIVEHDGKGGLAFDERPYVVMCDRAFVDLGTVEGPLPIP